MSMTWPWTAALCLALAGASEARQSSAKTSLEAARAHRSEHGAMILEEFRALLELPNVSSDLDGVRRNADHIVELLRRRGADVRAHAIDGVAPVVVGTLAANSKEPAEQRLGIYVHYDGQPVQPEFWAHPPFEPTLYTASMEHGGEPRPFPSADEAIDPQWRVYARAAGDDKAPIVALTAALDALAAAGIERRVDLVFLFEGEEEAGSDHLDQYLTELRDELQVDFWLICDGPVHASRQPQLVFGVRGVCGFEITVYGAARPLHSGHFGNWAPNPAQRLAALLASMKSDEGDVLIEGFYDSVEPLSELDRRAVEALPDVDASLKAELGLVETEGRGASIGERILLPSLNIRGLASAGVGPYARNVVPAEATAAIDIRLVRGNEPDAMIDLVAEHVRAQGYHVVSEEPDAKTRAAHARIARLTRSSGYRAVRTSMEHPFVPTLSRAAEAAAGEDTVLVPSLGGSLPLYLFEDILAAPLVILPIANHDNNQHAENENLRIANLWYGIDLFAQILALD